MTDPLPAAGYSELLGQIAAEVRSTRLRALRAANAEVIALNWRIGRLILRRQAQEGWGARVITLLSQDLRHEFPAMTGLSASNLQYMRAFATAWPDGSDFPAAVGKLPWGHVRTLLDRLDQRTEREWYADRAAEAGWSRQVLEHHIATGLHHRTGSAPSNFPAVLQAEDSDLARAIVKDPYVFDFLDLTDRAAERELEQALMDRLQDTLTELGRGFAFVGRQVRFDVDGDEFVVDLLLFHVEQLRYAVVELKIGKFKPEYTGQLGFYVAMVDDQLRRPGIHAATVGILLCAGRNERVVRYALRAAAAPMAVATYTYDKLPAEERTALPTVDDLTTMITDALGDDWLHADRDESEPEDR